MKNKKTILISGIIAVVLIVGAVYITNKKSINTMTDTDDMQGTTTGRQYEPIKEAEPGDLVVVNYTGTLENGTKFDSSYDRGQPFGFILGRKMVITGWDEGLLGVKRGDKKHLVIPGDKAYGSQEIKGPDGKVLIPKNSTLIFDIEVVEVVAKTKVDAMIKAQQDAQAEQAAEAGAPAKK